MYKLGLTGGIATGKSTVSNYLKNDYHLPILDADAIAHSILEPGQPALADIVTAFGPAMLNTDGSLNRSRLGEIVFNDAQARSKLNAMTHPRVFEQFRIHLQQLEQQGAPLVVLDIPLLFESQQIMDFDAICVVVTDEATQRQRLMDRNQLTKVQAQARIDSQLPLQDKIRRADFVIDNDGGLTQTYQQVDHMLNQIKRN